MAKGDFRMVFDATKLQRDLKKTSGEEAEKAVKKITNRDKLDVGDALIDEMKIAIAKGISPIKDAGRFPAYLHARSKDKSKYPFSVMDEFPDKKIRPVNLSLSGKFLKNLKAKVENGTLLVGFFEEPWSKYELGHREEANGQPKRPIIPQNEEQFSQSVYRRLVKALQQVFDRKK